MFEVIVNDEHILLRCGDKDELIANFDDFYENMSQRPGHTLTNISITISEALKEVFDNCEKLRGDRGSKSPCLKLALALFTKRCMAKHMPLKILVAGTDDGTTPWCLFKAANYFHNESEMVCAAYSVPGETFIKNTLRNGMPERRFSLFTGCPSLNHLRDDYFDIVLIDGEADSPSDPAATLQNALRVSKEGALLICISGEEYLLNSCFKAYLDGYGEYPSGPASGVLVKAVTAKDKGENERYLPRYGIKAMLERMEEQWHKISSAIDNLESLSHETVDETICALQSLGEMAVKVFGQHDNMDLKFQISEVKEYLINYSLVQDAQRRAGFGALCREKAGAVRL